MKRTASRAGLAAFAAMAALAGTAAAQDAPAVPAQEEEIMLTPGAVPPAATGTQWRAFSRSTTSVYLINIGEVVTEGDEVRVKIARINLATPAGDYSHVIDEFAIRCGAGESHLITTTEAYEDGEPADSFPADEPWSRIQAGSFDDGLKRISCGEATPNGDPFPSLRAYIDAGRP
jgi:hypothetical protein